MIIIVKFEVHLFFGTLSFLRPLNCVPSVLICNSSNKSSHLMLFLKDLDFPNIEGQKDWKTQSDVWPGCSVIVSWESLQPQNASKYVSACIVYSCTSLCLLASSLALKLFVLIVRVCESMRSGHLCFLIYNSVLRERKTERWREKQRDQHRKKSMERILMIDGQRERSHELDKETR